MNKLSAEELKFVLECVEEEDEVLCRLLEDSDEEEEHDDVLIALVDEGLRKKRNCIKGYFEDVVPSYSEKEFVTHFRIQKSLFVDICAKYECSGDKRMNATKCIAIFLWFAGHEACAFRDLADRFDASISSVSIIRRVSLFLSRLSPNIIVWPSQEQKIESSKFFNSRGGFSKAFGCIDGTHIEIDPPSTCKDEYIDREGNTSLILQGVCNEHRKFLNVFIGFPGSCHDSWVYQNSGVVRTLNMSCGDYYVLGDYSYPCTKNLITPYRDNGHLTRNQKRFNVRLSSCRVKIEHSFGILKQRFRQLYYCKLRGIRNICHFINACCVLHNIADEDDLEFVLEDQGTHPRNEEVPFGETTRGNLFRDAICRQQNATK